MTIEQRNRINAAHSTGPRTPEGKAIASQNARKHGLSIQRHVLLPTEDPAQYEALRADLHAIYHPQSDRESVAVDDLAQCRWAIQRIDAEELRILDQAPDDDPFPSSLLRIQRYRGHWERRHTRALRDFRQAALDRQRDERAQQMAAQNAHKGALLQQQVAVGEMDLEARRNEQRADLADRMYRYSSSVSLDKRVAADVQRCKAMADRELGYVTSPDTFLVRLATEQEKAQWAREDAARQQDAA